MPRELIYSHFASVSLQPETASADTRAVRRESVHKRHSNPPPATHARRAETQHVDSAIQSSEPLTESITCLVADDHPAVVQAVSDVLAKSGVQVTGQAHDGEQALDAIQRTQPNVALLDLRMPHLTGIEVARRCARVAPKTAIILYTAYSEQALLTEALDAGARGFVSKEAPLTEIIRAVQLVAEGRTYVDPVLAGAISRPAVTGKMSQLTQREHDVLRMLADGHSNDEIGKALFISPETVRTHVRKAMARLDADTRTQAVATAIRQSLLA